MRTTTLALLLLVVAGFAFAPAAAHAPATKSCVLVGHGTIAGVNTATGATPCILTGTIDHRLFLNVTFTSLNVGSVIMDVQSQDGGELHVVVCSVHVVTTSCAIAIQQVFAVGTWTVTARAVTSDPVGTFTLGSDSYARLDATFI